MTNDTKQWLLLGYLAAVLVFMIACGGTSSKASGTAQAVSIPGPGGRTCFAILNGNGEAVGGNCP